MAIFVIIKIDFYCFFFLFCRDHLITTAQPVPKHTSDHATVSNLLMNAHCRNIVHLQEWMFAVERCSIEIYHNFSSHQHYLFYHRIDRSQFPLLILINSDSIFSLYREPFLHCWFYTFFSYILDCCSSICQCNEHILYTKMLQSPSPALTTFPSLKLFHIKYLNI